MAWLLPTQFLDFVPILITLSLPFFYAIQLIRIQSYIAKNNAEQME